MSLSSTSARELAIRETQVQTLTRHFGRPTHQGVNKFRDEITAIYAAAKTSHPDFPLEEKFGYAAAVMKTAKFCTLHDKAVSNIANLNALDPVWQFVHPQRPDIYDSAVNITDLLGMKQL